LTFTDFGHNHGITEIERWPSACQCGAMRRRIMQFYENILSALVKQIYASDFKSVEEPLPAGRARYNSYQYRERIAKDSGISGKFFVALFGSILIRIG